MKEASRIQAIIELLDEVFQDKLPADVILDKYFKTRRYIGSKDRRFIADNVWNIIRKRMSLSCALKNNTTARLITALYFSDSDLELLFNGEEYAPSNLSKEEKNILEKATNLEISSDEVYYETPKWLIDKFSDLRLLSSLNSKASTDVRVNLTDRTSANNRLRKEGLFFSNTPYSPIGLRCEDRINLNNCMTYLDGEIEVMDEASQLIALLCDTKPHHKIIDYCAGAGGKSLAISSIMSNDGIIYAHDISQERLNKIKKRAERLDITNIKIINEVKDKDYNRFIIDAPCSGSGTWRRSPDAKYRLTKEKLDDICKTQAEILDFGAKHTKAGGLLIYITCSVFSEENEKQIEKFLERNNDFSVVNHHELWNKVLDLNIYPFDSDKYLKFSPLTTKTDGFFFCALKKNN